MGSGTSIAAPMLAGLFATLNSVRAAHGKPPLGFLNPFIYQNRDAFKDIAIGRGTGCEGKGFAAGPGWDPVTGVGVPDFSKLVQAVLKLP